MSLLLYGIVAEDAHLQLEPELQSVRAAGLAAIVSVNVTELSREAAVVLAYGEQINRIHQQTTLIPMRYGNVVVNESAIIEHLHDRGLDYQQRLMALADCEEMGIRLRLDACVAQTTRASSGHAYLLARKRAYTVPDDALEEAARLNHGLAGLYRQHCAELSIFNGQRTYLLSYLVARIHLTAFHSCLTRLNKHGVITGPWPPYNFVSENILFQPKN